MTRLLVTIFALTIAAFFSSLGTESAHARKVQTPRTACAASKLKLKNCHLNLRKYKVQVWKDKIFIHDGVRRSMTDLPLKESEWVEVSLQEMGGRTFLEFVAWDVPKGEGAVEAKKWYVYELLGERAHFRIEKLIQRRKRLEGDKYHFDRLMKYGLRLEGRRDSPIIQWYAGREKGYIE